MSRFSDEIIFAHRGLYHFFSSFFRHSKKISFETDQEEGINVITSEISVVNSSKQEHKCSSASRHSKPGKLLQG